ncbi:MAG TPA: ABC transporter permease [Vicinamibacteria bacterium]|jgi:putative ABC transport system permease protein
MNSRLLARLAWQGLALHKLRSLLSAIGIVFGVAAVVAMMSVGEGARQEILAEIGSFGLRRVSILAESLSEEGRSEAASFQSPGLTLRDAEAISEVCPTVASLAPLRQRSVQVVTAEGREEALLVATTPSFSRTEEIAIAEGRFLTDADLADLKRVVVLGNELSEGLFPYRDAVGQDVRIGGDWFSVVGTLEPRDRARRNRRLGSRDVNRIAFAPLTSVPAPHDAVDEIAISIVSSDEVRGSARLIDSVLARRHRGARDYRLVVPQVLLAGYERARSQFNVVVGSVAAISLLVGGIGIMNIMLANVSERTREIGIRRSLGASRADIVRQFLAEAVLLTGAGGAVGTLLGVLASVAVSRYAGWATSTSALAVLTALALATVTGLGFGIYPAWQAASKNPVEALRHE